MCNKLVLNIMHIILITLKVYNIKSFFSDLLALDFFVQNDVKFVQSIIINTSLYECVYITRRL